MPNDLNPQAMRLPHTGRENPNFSKNLNSGLSSATIWTLSGIVLAACGGGGGGGGGGISVRSVDRLIAYVSSSNGPEDLKDPDDNSVFQVIGVDPDGDDITYTVAAVPSNNNLALAMPTASTTSNVSFGSLGEASRVDVTVGEGYGIKTTTTPVVIGTLSVVNNNNILTFTFDPNQAAFDNLGTGDDDSLEVIGFLITPNDGNADGDLAFPILAIDKDPDGTPDMLISNQYPTIEEVNGGTVRATGIITISDDAALASLRYQYIHVANTKYDTGDVPNNFPDYPDFTDYVLGTSGAIDTTYGSFTLTVLSEGRARWTYTLDDSALDGLNSGESVQELIRLAATDAQGNTEFRNIIITIDGVNEPPSSFPVQGQQREDQVQLNLNDDPAADNPDPLDTQGTDGLI